ncbi:EAL domain-containing protein [Novosphingobium sp. B 225]|uniref:EAL domain-containing protein n=1 Tax=Novosphingobium sp. B 225 TaxID=1961849 RepID=UPI000B4AF256|nr:EAL domain-containing protein [Novosphingobium sp. B 225]
MTAQPARQLPEAQPAPRPTAPTSAAAEAAPRGAPRTAVSTTGSPGQLRQQAARTDRAARHRQTKDHATLVHMLDRNWTVMAPVLGIALLLNGVASWSTPPLGTALLGIMAVAVAAFTPIAVRIERDHCDTGTKHFGMLLAVVGLPMLLFGLAIARWKVGSDVDWSDSLGLLIICAALAAVILNRRVIALIVSQIGLWIGVTVMAGTIETWAGLALGVAVGIFVGQRESKANAAAIRAQIDRERAQLRAEEILNDFEQTGQGWFWESDRRGVIVYVSPTVAQLLGSKSLTGRPFTELFVNDPAGQDSERTLAFHLNARSAFSELGIRAAIGHEERWWSISGRPIYDSFGNFLGFRGSGHDLTEKRRSEENATRLAHYDSLTGLANRLQMAQTLEKILAAPHIEHRACSVFLLDLDRFKQVNDTMGHPAGDALLKMVSSRLERTVGEAGRVGRLGGDEFQVVLAGHHRREDLAELARRVIHDLSEPYTIEGHRVVIGASVGIALSPADGVTAEAIIRNADLALYAAKDGGRGRHHFYAADLHSDAEERRQLEQDLRDALAHDGLELYYQPVVHTSTERITGFEALLRWNHPTRGMMSPAKFIPIAEDTGLIAPIGEWALRTACRDLSQWPESVRVAVNVSPLQFSNPALPAIITNALASAQISPQRLELEITESVFLNDDAGTDAMFAALKRVGVRLSLDDFGTGYSSLGYLKKAPFDKIKIDQSFVRGATIVGSRNGAIISSIVSLAEALGMETTAEGVETLDELDLVRMLGCSHVQGYIYEKPLTVAAATQRLLTGLTAIAKGPRAARAVRQTMLRKITLEHGAQQYQGTIRNISTTGAMVEGLWNVPPGTIFRIMLAEGGVVTATARWCQEDRMGVEFAAPLLLDESGRIAVLGTGAAKPRSGLLRQTGEAA